MLPFTPKNWDNMQDAVQYFVRKAFGYGIRLVQHNSRFTQPGNVMTSVTLRCESAGKKSDNTTSSIKSDCQVMVKIKMMGGVASASQQCFTHNHPHSAMDPNGNRVIKAELQDLSLKQQAELLKNYKDGVSKEVILAKANKSLREAYESYVKGGRLLQVM